uniref:Uncharacterized protein n=1 Tax=Parascaris equorum TaxID=6256 RepID=A0A914RXM1_PAREQ
ETISIHLGLSQVNFDQITAFSFPQCRPPKLVIGDLLQVEMTGNSLLDYLHREDIANLRELTERYERRLSSVIDVINAELRPPKI